MSTLWRRSVRRVVAAILAVAVSAGALMALQETASAQVPAPSTAVHAALSGSSFQPGYIISDYAFYNKSAMTQTEIQTFLNKECPTNNCINTVTAPTNVRAASNMCPGGYTSADTETTAEIIYRVQVSCGISAKVMLVTLQKEQGLITARNPTALQLRKAMGYGCADSAPACNSLYYGLFNQIYDAASQFVRYGLPKPDNISFHTKFQIGVPYPIAYAPAGRLDEHGVPCATRTVTVQNKATTALYYYTPYTPDPSALANVTGSGDNCASYGNRNFWVYYNEWFGSPTTTVPPGVTVSRISADDRYGVAVGLSQANFAPGVPVVYIANGANFPDALSAGAAAAKQGGPLLLVQPDLIPSEVSAELTRLAPQRIVVVGGPASVTPAVFTALSAFAPTITRVGGIDRYAVSRGVAQTVFGTSGAAKVFIATGGTFPDALSASAAAGSESIPVILIDGLAPTLDPNLVTTLTALGVKQIDIAGGPASVLPTVQAQLAAVPGVTGVIRYAGEDRYQVSGALNRGEFGSAAGVYVATGVTFPDALAGAAVAGAHHDPLYIVQTSCIPSYVIDDFLNLKPATMTILGGTGSLTSGIEEFEGC